MPQNPFDKAARFATKLDAPGFLGRLLGLPPDLLGFGGWLDTRGLPFPGEPDRTGDTVARLDPPGGTEPPWAVAVEFQTEPDPAMFGRLLGYLAQLWLHLRPDPERGSRFQVGAAVVNLTGTGLASREMRLPGTGLVTHLAVVERNLASESADDTVGAIEAGTLSRGVLPWVPLMAGGGDDMIAERWKRLAEVEPARRRRSEYAGLALVFADAAVRRDTWELALRGWNVKESTVVNDWIAEGRQIGVELGIIQGRALGVAQGIIQGRALGVAQGIAQGIAQGQREERTAAVLAILEEKFGGVPEDLAAAVRGCDDLVKLREWIGLAVRADTLAAFRAAAGV